jgi:EAL domain-containing protein (putative c-di-GMP-specific phosphodiesterase class I)
VAAPDLHSPPRAQRGRLLLVDDDPLIVRSYTRMLGNEGYEVDTCYDGEAAAEAVRAQAYDVVITDLEMPRLGGLGLIERIRSYDQDVPVVLVTGNPTLETAIAAVERGALRYVPKPVDGARLRSIVTDAVRLHRLARARRDALDVVAKTEALAFDRDTLSAGFDRALGSLWMAYQPIVAWSRREVYGYEALLRSREPSLPHPGAILDAAERLDRLNALGRTIRERAPEPAARMPDGAMLFVNLHTRDLLDDDLFDAGRPLARMADKVVLEITERASLHQVRDLQSRLARLREMGFRLAVDDLGAGYAGLTSFAQLEPEVVKLDMALVRNVHQQPTKLTLVRTMIAMCRELGMAVVAEGIETPEERDAIVDAGCDLLQGYLFAKPGEPFPAPSLT